MARVRKTTLGGISGKLGDIVYHNRHGERFIRVRPKSFVPGTDAASVDRRSRFAFSVRLARAIYSVPELKLFWERAAQKEKSIFNFVVGSNVNLVTADRPTELATITPPSRRSRDITGLLASPGKVSTSSGVVSVDSSALWDRTVGPAPEGARANLAYVLCLGNPAESRRASQSKGKPVPEFITGCSKAQQILTDSVMTFKVRLEDREAKKLSRYKEKNLLCAILMFDSKGKPVRYSKTAITRI